MAKTTKKKKLTNTELTVLGKMFEKYQKKMRLWDWNITIQVELNNRKGELAEVREMDIKNKSAIFSMTLEGYKFKPWEKIVIHELSHILLKPWRDKMFQVIKTRDKYIEKNCLKPTKKTKMIEWANEQTGLLEQWIDLEEEIICTQMEHIVYGSC